MSTRTMIRSIAPPILVTAARAARDRMTGSREALPVWEHVPEGWARAATDPFIRGWNVPAIRDWHRRRFELWSQAYEEPRPLGTSEYASSSAQYLHPHNLHVTSAFVLAKAAAGRTRLSVLDWGGGVGQHYLLSRGALPELELSYHCRDLPLVCELGRELNPDVTFYDDDSCFQRRYDLVVASNSLQYNEDWRDGLRKLGRAAIDCLYVAQLPTVLDTGSFVAVQRPYGYGFDTEYLGWIFNRDEFLSAVDSLGLEVTREFFFGNSVDVHGVDEPAVHRGFLMRPRG